MHIKNISYKCLLQNKYIIQCTFKTNIYLNISPSPNGLFSKALGGTGGGAELEPLLRFVLLKFNSSIDPENIYYPKQQFSSLIEMFSLN